MTGKGRSAAGNACRSGALRGVGLMEDDIWLVDTDCPNCGRGQTATRECDSCFGEGFIDLYEEDPLYYDEDDTEPCPDCKGAGYHNWCQGCGYDLVLGRVLNG